MRLAALASASLILATCGGPKAAVPATIADQTMSTRVLALVQDDGSNMKLQARPVDPETLADVPGKAPISFEHHYTSAISPDGRTLAAIMWPNGSGNRGGALHLIDLVNWTDRLAAPTFDDHVGQLLFGEGGRDLYWVLKGPKTSEPAFETEPGLYRYELASGKLRRIVDLPQTFVPSSVGLAGDRLATIGWTAGGTITPTREPVVFVIDLSKERIAATFQLAGMRDGQVLDPGGGPDDIRNVRPAVAWDLVRRQVFVVDGEEDRVAVVDLATGTLKGPTSIGLRRSLVDRIFALVSSPAEAKIQATTQRWAVVSPDGRRLYVSGLRSDFPGDGSRERVIPLGMLVVDTSNMTEVGRLDITSGDLTSTPDGKGLLVITNRFEPPRNGWSERVGYELRLIDTERLAQVASISLEGRARILKLGSHGDAYLNAVAESGSFTMIRRVNLTDLAIVATRNVDRHVGELIGN
jgi:hypothetical protein